MVRTLVFLHGFLGNKEDWDPVISLLSTEYRCIAIDLPGHGKSVNDISLRALEEEIAPYKGSAIIGYSMGGRLALQCAMRSPDHFSHVIALSAHPGLDSEQERKERWKRDQEWIAKLYQPSFLTEWYQQPIFHSLRQKPDLLNAILKKRAGYHPDQMAQVLEIFSLSKQLKIQQFHPRTLLMCGNEDWKYVELYSTLGDKVCVRQMERAGHTLHLEQPKLVAQEIAAWIRM